MHSRAAMPTNITTENSRYVRTRRPADRLTMSLEHAAELAAAAGLIRSEEAAPNNK